LPSNVSGSWIEADVIVSNCIVAPQDVSRDTSLQIQKRITLIRRALEGYLACEILAETLRNAQVPALPLFFSAGTDCSCIGFVAPGGANGGGNPTKARKMKIGIRQ
jgi:hypothetical protein